VTTGVATGSAAGVATGGAAGPLAALVGGEPVTAAEVAAEVARLRAGPLADRLPPDGTPAGRQLRRWTTQRLVLSRLLDQEAAARGLPPQPERAGPRPEHAGPGEPDAALLGSAAADVLATSATARAVYTAVTAAVSVPEPEIRVHYEANLDRYTVPERWLVRLSTVDAVGVDRQVPVDPATLPPSLRAALSQAPPGHPVGAHAGQVAIRDEVRPARIRPYPEVRGEIAGTLLDRCRQQAFARWLDGRAGELVALQPGYEHPADPHNPDATHRH
jgi:[acyl-carrier-protein] S-malonyltransferase